MSLVTFIKERIVPINAVIALSVTLSLALDFLAPKAPYLAWLSYGLAALVLLCMAAELIAPIRVGRWLGRSSQGLLNPIKRLWMGYSPAWRSPAWQAVAAVTATVLVLGQVSKAKAADGGILASQFPQMSNLQAVWLDLKKDNQAVKAAVKEVSDKVDELKTAGKYENAGEALQNGDYAAVKAFLAKGDPLPPANTTLDYTLASGMSYKRAGRLELLGLYAKDGFDINQRGKPLILGAYTTPKDTADKLAAWGKAKGIPYQPMSCELTLLHVATVTADKEAIDWLLKHGASKDAQAVCLDGMGRKTRPFTVVELASVL